MGGTKTERVGGVPAGRGGRERAELRCPACGAGNRLAAGVVDTGFQRCAHCRAPMPVEGAGAFAFERRGGGFTRVVSPGRSLFILLLGRVLSLPAFFAIVLLGEGVAGIARRIVARLTTPALGWSVIGLYVVAGVAAFLLLCVQQRILVTQNRMETWWRLFGLRLRRRRFGTHGLTLEARDRWPRFLRIGPPGEAPVRVALACAGEAAILEEDLRQAVRDTQQSAAAEALRCPGCGGPIATPMTLVERGGVDCPHCGAGVVAVKGGVLLGPCELVHDLDESAQRVRPRRRRRAGGVDWDLRSQYSAGRLAAVVAWLFMLLLGLGIAGTGVAFAWAADEWRSFGLIVAAVLGALGLGLCGMATTWQFGRHRLRVDGTVLEHELFLGRWRVRRRVEPLARVVSVTVAWRRADVNVEVKTAVARLEIDLPQRGTEGEAVALDVLREIRTSVEAQRRQTTWTVRPRERGRDEPKPR